MKFKFMMTKTEFEIDIKHGKYLGEKIIGLLVISGSRSVILDAVNINRFRSINITPKTSRRLN